MNAIKNDALSIAKAIEVLEAPLAEIRKEIPGYKEFPMIVPEGRDLLLLSEFIDGVNSEFGSAALERMQLVALDANGFHEWYAWIKGSVPFAVVWAAVRRYCGAGRCSLKVKAGDEEIDVSAATAEEAERLFHAAARFTIYRLGDAPSQGIEEANKARLDNRP